MSHLKLLAKAALTAGLLWLLFSRIDPGVVLRRYAAIPAGLVIVALALMAAQLPLAALRWVVSHSVV